MELILNWLENYKIEHADATGALNSVDHVKNGILVLLHVNSTQSWRTFCFHFLAHIVYQCNLPGVRHSALSLVSLTFGPFIWVPSVFIFKMVQTILQSRTFQVFILQLRFFLPRFVSRSCLLSVSLIIFLSPQFVWWYPLPVFPKYLQFYFSLFWLFYSFPFLFFFVLHIFIICVARFPMPNSIHINCLYSLIVYISFFFDPWQIIEISSIYIMRISHIRFSWWSFTVVSSSFQDSSQYSGWTLQCSSWAGLDSSTDFQLSSPLYQAVGDRSKRTNYNWYHHYSQNPHLRFKFSDGRPILVLLSFASIIIIIIIIIIIHSLELFTSTFSW